MVCVHVRLDLVDQIVAYAVVMLSAVQILLVSVGKVLREQTVVLVSQFSMTFSS